MCGTSDANKCLEEIGKERWRRLRLVREHGFRRRQGHTRLKRELEAEKEDARARHTRLLATSYGFHELVHIMK